MRYLDEWRNCASDRSERVRVAVLIVTVMVASFVMKQLINGDPVAGEFPAGVVLGLLLAWNNDLHHR